jgi:ABC-type lipoprotein export system ATPase subunit
MLRGGHPAARADRFSIWGTIATFAGVIVVTHDHRALDIFDRALEMEDGLIRGTPAAVP